MTIDLTNPDDLNDPDENYEWMDPENRAELRSMYPDFDVEQGIDRADQ